MYYPSKNQSRTIWWKKENERTLFSLNPDIIFCLPAELQRLPTVEEVTPQDYLSHQSLNCGSHSFAYVYMRRA